jgi:hypothetical protein
MKRFGPILLGLTLTAIAAWSAVPDPAPRSDAGPAGFEPNLPVVLLQTAKPIGSEPRVPCSVTLVLPNGAGPGSTGALGGLIRFHGATSQGYPKKSFALTLNAPVRWPGLRESPHWVLNAAFVDRSLMRHKLSYDLFQSLSAEGARRFASSSRFVEVNLNGRYHGAYLLMERVDRALLELRRYDSNATSQAVIYKAVDHSANFGSEGHPGYEQREPSPEVREYWGPMDELNGFVSRASKETFFDPEKGVASRLDLDNVIDFHLLVLLTSNVDGIDKNFIIARDAATTTRPAPKFFFVPWDYDATFGRSWEASRVGPNEWMSSHLFDRLLADAGYRQRFAARWRKHRANQFSVQNLTRMIDQNARVLGDAVQRNETRWKTLDGPYPDRLSFNQDLEQMKEWIVARITWLDADIARRTGVAAQKP